MSEAGDKPVLHGASCVALDGAGLLIEGVSGSGKSMLALGLIDRGAVLVGDDGVCLVRRGEHLLASPAPHISGLLEVRNLGLLSFPVIGNVPIALVLRLDPEAPRFIEAADRIVLHGTELPMLRLWPGGSDAVLKAELAMKRFALGSAQG